MTKPSVTLTASFCGLLHVPSSTYRFDLLQQKRAPHGTVQWMWNASISTMNETSMSSEGTVHELGGGIRGEGGRIRKTTVTSVSNTPLQESKRATRQLQPSGNTFTTW
jgi:hypothetical protein